MVTAEEKRLAAIKKQQRKVNKLLKEAEGLSGGRTPEQTRAMDRNRKRGERDEARAVFIPDPKDPAGRCELEQDVYAWLRWYLPDVFPEPFQKHHVEMIEAILAATTYAGDQAIAAPRGEGKTTIAECVTMFCIFKGVVSFSVLFAATAGDARNSLASIKQYIAESDRMADDYPEVCLPVREVTSSPNRAHSFLCKMAEDGEAIQASFQWSGDEVTMPAVPGSVCAGSIIATRGLDSAVRGLKKGSVRPQLALIDDPDTEDSARSEEQAKKLEMRIDRAIAGLAPKGQRMSRMMLTTLQNRTCVSAKFTDPKQKPSWNGKRFGFLSTPPDREDLWDEYVALRQSSMSAGDTFARKAHDMYLVNREAMDLGAIVANPFSFDSRDLADGSQLQVSALQRYYDFVADNGIDAALCELQNDPPEEVGPTESGISAHRVQTSSSGYDRKVIPPDCTVITQGIDVRKVALHWVVRAWRPDATGFVIDYGVTEVHGTTVGLDEGVDLQIIKALRTRRQDMEDQPYATVDGEIMPIDLTLVDAGWKTEAIYAACREFGQLDWKPSMGFGKSAGCVRASFRDSARNTDDHKAGDGWYLTRRPGKVWLVGMDSDRWKGWEHARWMTPGDKPGSLSIFGSGDKAPAGRMNADQKAHHSYARHIVSEVEVEEPVKNILKRYWKAKTDNNHWLDASYASDVAANMKGIVLADMRVAVKQRNRMKMSDLQKNKRT